MLKFTIEISQYSLLHVSVHLGRPQGAYVEPCYSYTFVKLISKNTSLQVRLSRKLYGTQYTHDSLKHMLPQHCKTYNDIFLLINSAKV
jgi:hypothetical protein